MKRALVLLLVIGLAGICHAETLKKRITGIEQRVEQLEEAVRRMGEGSATVGKNTELFMDDTLPDAGEVKVVKAAPLVLDACESASGWSKVSGPGTVTFTAVSDIVHDGTYSVVINISEVGTYVVKTLFAAKNLTLYRSVKQWLFRSGGAGWTGFTVAISITDDGGERGPDVAATPPAGWSQRNFDISGYSGAQKDVVTEVKLTIVSPGRYGNILYVDNIFADSGPSQVAFNDGDRIGYLNPPYFGSYSGNGGASQVIALLRKGNLKGVIIQSSQGTYGTANWKTADMGGTNSLSLTTPGTFETDRITALGDGSFTVGASLHTNRSGYTYYFMAIFED